MKAHPPLDGHDRLGRLLHLTDPAPEPRALAEKPARGLVLRRARLLDQARDERGDLGGRRVVEDAPVDHLRDEELVVVPQRRHQLPLRPEHALLDGVERVQDLEHPPVLLPDRVPDGLERRAAVLEPAALLLDRLPRGVAAGARLPRAGMALDALERVLGVAAALPLDQSAETSSSLEAREERAALVGQRLPEVAPPPAMVGREVPDRRRQQQGRRRPEHALDVPRLRPDERAVRKQRVEQDAVPAQPVHPDRPPRARRRSRAAGAARPAPARRRRAPGPGAGRERDPARAPARLDLGAKLPIAPDPIETPRRAPRTARPPASAPWASATSRSRWRICRRLWY